jgi:hypothetical protein
MQVSHPIHGWLWSEMGKNWLNFCVVSVETTTCVAEFASPYPDNLSKVVVGDSVISTIK